MSVHLFITEIEMLYVQWQIAPLPLLYNQGCWYLYYYVQLSLTVMKCFTQDYLVNCFKLWGIFHYSYAWLFFFFFFLAIPVACRISWVRNRNFSSNQSHSSDNAGPLTLWAITEPLCMAILNSWNTEEIGYSIELIFFFTNREFPSKHLVSTFLVNNLSKKVEYNKSN